nr:hypothetical protein [Desulforamulus aquiferis]
MTYLAFKSIRGVYRVKCQKCGQITELPQEPGEYLCQSCGIPLAKVTQEQK